ncbi:hypothetical protein BDF20DRAFT_289333 [Mycotypha africana]|uniref:uncharacterized protein n=1 Tax=Mycotypha africana TaxID=64632 RepID=UPI002301B3F4|nr:uncharacterized protein BDF20DRAFT_289333 [Mycotypha africana]KAI8987787.1 hypothetical protein BDF20DRAFT_289333 [Mycotypha africana]
MSLSDFENLKSVKQQEGTNPSTSIFNPNYHAQQYNESCMPQSSSTSEPASSLNTARQTYAQIVDSNTPAWAVEEGPTHLVKDTSDRTYNRGSSFADNDMTQLPQFKQTVYDPASTSFSNKTTSDEYIPAIKRFPDYELINYLISVRQKKSMSCTLYTFQKKLEHILQNDLLRLADGQFHHLLNAIVDTMDYEKNHSLADTPRKIYTYWTTFKLALHRYINYWMASFDDFQNVLRFTIDLTDFFPKLIDNELLQNLVVVYRRMKPHMPPDILHACQKSLSMITGYTFEEQNIEETNNMPATLLPEIPTAKDIVMEIVEKINPLQIYESKSGSTITNQIYSPWPNCDLQKYLSTHYFLLRQELTEPIKSIIKSLYCGDGNENSLPDCAIYGSCVPKYTTLSMVTSEPGIIFQFDYDSANIELMRNDIAYHLTEGSFVMLMSEDVVDNGLKHSYNHSAKELDDMILEGAANQCMLAQVIRTYRTINSAGDLVRLISVHILNDDVSRLRWSDKYTLISSKINARSVLSTLSWLFEEFNRSDITRFSAVLTPRILTAQNKLMENQLISWAEGKHNQNPAANGRSVPEYLADAEIDISCITYKNAPQTARPGQNLWPRYASGWEHVAPSKRIPIYNLSSSQIKAVQFALTHRIAAISGAAGTGKTYLAAKLAIITSRALVQGQFHQPVLVISKSQECLDSILLNVAQSVKDIVRFGPPSVSESLKSSQATSLCLPNSTDSNYRQFISLDRRLNKNQCHLETLLKYRNQIVNHDPRVICSAAAPKYLGALQKGYTYYNNASANLSTVWSLWLDDDSANPENLPDYAQQLENNYNEAKTIQAEIEDLHLRIGGRGIMPLLDSNTVKSRFNHSRNTFTPIQPIGTAHHWPFDSSARRATDVRYALNLVWNQLPSDQVWEIPVTDRKKIAENLEDTLLRFVDEEIQSLLQEQSEIGRTIDDMLIQKLTYLCRFKNVIGMTADFAAANNRWVSNLWPRTVIVDEASEILETTLAPSISGFRTEHVILLGTGDSVSRVPLTNPSLVGEPRNFDVSLFERWKASTGEIVLLEEQWRMHSGVATIHDQFNGSRNNKHTPSTLLITAPVASCNENRVDGKNAVQEKLHGVTERAYYIHYKSEFDDDGLDEVYTEKFRLPITQSNVDEARYVSFLAVYLSQQPYMKTSIGIITLSPLQKAMIRHILREEVPTRTCFTSQLKKLHLEMVDFQGGREYDYVIISTATPGSTSALQYDNVSRAVTRARYGLYIIGKPETDKVHPSWQKFAKYMEERELYGHSLLLTCTTHGDQIAAKQANDFDKVKNGGCQRPCGSLMAEGHACKEDCHFLSHEEVKCQEPCNRPRPRNCTHACKRKCFECSKQGACPPCQEQLSITLNCGHIKEGICHELQDIENVRCEESVDVSLPCGHTITVACSDRNANLQCKEKCKVQLVCGHAVETTCGVKPICSEMCPKNLECGHKCPEMCGVYHDHKRSSCVANCPKQLICGHYCANGCANPDNHTERCMEKCRYVCSHGYKCSRECWRDCTRCVSECPYRCEHYKCTRKCYEKCDRPPCNFPCRKILHCKHPCAGLCGEPCPPCVICEGNKHECSISLRFLSEFDEGERLYMLPECGCVFSVENLDLYFENQAKNGEHTAIKLWGCPTCGKTIYRALRYNQYIKTEIALVNKIKLRIEQERNQLTHHERQQIIKAMNEETAQQINHNIVGGRWFVCENQHPYFVGDCGGATQISKCPECDAPIGGTQHKVLQSNRFYGEFDGSEKPAWPGQPVGN